MMDFVMTDDALNIKHPSTMSETFFKEEYLKLLRRNFGRASFFCIETEETEPGMPDVLGVMRDKTGTVFLEFKVADNRRMIKFQHTQPSWYYRNSMLPIYIVAFDPITRLTFTMSPDHALSLRTLYYYLPEPNRTNGHKDYPVALRLLTGEPL